MSGTSILIDHYRRPRQRGTAARPDLRREIHNRKCGDRITLTAQIEADRIQEIRFEGEGCMYCLASASILCHSLSGMQITLARRQIALFRSWISDRKPPEGEGSAEHSGITADSSGHRTGSHMEDTANGDTGDSVASGPGLTGEMLALGEVKAFPMRIDCADLAWKCAGEMLDP
jgi:nitrogen fixation protein NifU and related proteins